MEAKRHEVIDDMISTVKAVVLDVLADPDDEVAEMIANEVADRFVEKWAKETIYIPEDLNYKVQLKNIEIFQSHRQGVHIKHIARSHKVSVQHIYDIIRKMREEYSKKIQPDMFTE